MAEKEVGGTGSLVLEPVGIFPVDWSNTALYVEDLDLRCLDNLYRLFHIWYRLRELRRQIKRYYGDRE